MNVHRRKKPMRQKKNSDSVFLIKHKKNLFFFFSSFFQCCVKICFFKRFVTKSELEDVGLGHLIGTPLLRAYMHGFFVDAKLHRFRPPFSMSLVAYL